MRRIAAWLIDCGWILAWIGVTVAIGVPLYLAGVIQPVNQIALNLIGAGVLVFPVVVAAGYFESRAVSATPGKRALGLIVRSPGGRPTFPAALLRNAVKIGIPWLIAHAVAIALAGGSQTASTPAWVWIITGAAYVIPLVWLASLFTRSGRTVYDRVSRTAVHRRLDTPSAAKAVEGEQLR